ncbi:Hypothetical_protein [Hexamita inflata]|uniref:Hypothetical_protein n=1 Tax=Hexamita inflata TaxID=28002 RepID=A0AA86UGC1_9EUKA|nr:Hypothetical protein HINF_LOCUS42389 [Hexamita inflata]
MQNTALINDNELQEALVDIQVEKRRSASPSKLLQQAVLEGEPAQKKQLSPEEILLQNVDFDRLLDIVLGHENSRQIHIDVGNDMLKVVSNFQLRHILQRVQNFLIHDVIIEPGDLFALRKHKKETEDHNAALKLEIIEHERIQVLLNERIESLREEIANHKQHIESIKSELDRTSRILLIKNERIEELNGLIQTKDILLQEKQDQITELHHQLMSSMKVQEDQKQKLSYVNNQVNKQQEQIVSYDRILDQQIKQSEKAINALKTDAGTQQQTIVNLKTELDAQNELMNKQKLTIEHLQKVIKRQEFMQQALETKLSQKQQHVAYDNPVVKVVEEPERLQIAHKRSRRTSTQKLEIVEDPFKNVAVSRENEFKYDFDKLIKPKSTVAKRVLLKQSSTEATLRRSISDTSFVSNQSKDFEKIKLSPSKANDSQLSSKGQSLTNKKKTLSKVKLQNTSGNSTIYESTSEVLSEQHMEQSKNKQLHQNIYKKLNRPQTQQLSRQKMENDTLSNESIKLKSQKSIKLQHINRDSKIGLSFASNTSNASKSSINSQLYQIPTKRAQSINISKLKSFQMNNTTTNISEHKQQKYSKFIQNQTNFRHNNSFVNVSSKQAFTQSMVALPTTNSNDLSDPLIEKSKSKQKFDKFSQVSQQTKQPVKQTILQRHYENIGKYVKKQKKQILYNRIYQQKVLGKIQQKIDQNAKNQLKQKEYTNKERIDVVIKKYNIQKDFLSNSSTLDYHNRHIMLKQLQIKQLLIELDVFYTGINKQSREINQQDISVVQSIEQKIELYTKQLAQLQVEELRLHQLNINEISNKIDQTNLQPEINKDNKNDSNNIGMQSIQFQESQLKIVKIEDSESDLELSDLDFNDIQGQQILYQSSPNIYRQPKLLSTSLNDEILLKQSIKQLKMYKQLQQKQHVEYTVVNGKFMSPFTHILHLKQIIQKMKNEKNISSQRNKNQEPEYVQQLQSLSLKNSQVQYKENIKDFQINFDKNYDIQRCLVNITNEPDNNIYEIRKILMIQSQPKVLIYNETLETLDEAQYAKIAVDHILAKEKNQEIYQNQSIKYINCDLLQGLNEIFQIDKIKIQHHNFLKMSLKINIRTLQWCLLNCREIIQYISSYILSAYDSPTNITNLIIQFFQNKYGQGLALYNYFEFLISVINYQYVAFEIWIVLFAVNTTNRQLLWSLFFFINYIKTDLQINMYLELLQKIYGFQNEQIEIERQNFVNYSIIPQYICIQKLCQHLQNYINKNLLLFLHNIESKQEQLQYNENLVRQSVYLKDIVFNNMNMEFNHQSIIQSANFVQAVQIFQKDEQKTQILKQSQYILTLITKYLTKLNLQTDNQLIQQIRQLCENLQRCIELKRYQLAYIIQFIIRQIFGIYLQQYGNDNLSDQEL